jgi:hypothetical protein
MKDVIFVRNFGFKISRPRGRWEDNFKVEFIETIRHGVHWIRQAENNDK